MAGAQCDFILVILHMQDQSRLAGSIFGFTIGARFWRQPKRFLILPDYPEAILDITSRDFNGNSSLRFLNRLID